MKCYLKKKQNKSEKAKSCATPECRWFSFCVRMCVRVWYKRDEIFVLISDYHFHLDLILCYLIVESEMQNQPKFLVFLHFILFYSISFRWINKQRVWAAFCLHFKVKSLVIITTVQYFNLMLFCLHIWTHIN